MGAFGADGSGDAGAEKARRTDILRKLGMYLTQLRNFVHGGLVNLFLGVEAGAHGPFMEKMQERTAFDKPDGFGVGKEVERNFDWHAAVEKLILGGPGFLHCTVVDFFGARIVGNEHGQDVIWVARVGERKERARTGDHAVALVLAV